MRQSRDELRSPASPGSDSLVLNARGVRVSSSSEPALPRADRLREVTSGEEHFDLTYEVEVDVLILGRLAGRSR